jgi:DNA-binding LacI/PurR family transcriptional regulator
MADVARLAGVSAQTVSRTLSGHPNVREHTKAKVLAAVEELGYRKNDAARVLSSGRSHTLGIVVFETMFYSRSAATVGVETAAHRAGYTVSAVTVASMDSTAIQAAMTRLSEHNVEGIILALPLVQVNKGIEDLTRAIPTVCTDGSRTASTHVVTVDQHLAGRMATEHLLSLGHETVWHVSGPESWIEAGGRTQGWRETLEASGRFVPPALQGDWSPASGYQNGLILGRIPDVTAVFVASDEMAFGVIRALHELGKRVPEDISVIGVDDIPLAEYCSPSLTTVAQPFGFIGERAVERLIAAIDDPQTPAETELIEPTLIVRSSTGAPAAAS